MTLINDSLFSFFLITLVKKKFIVRARTFLPLSRKQKKSTKAKKQKQKNKREEKQDKKDKKNKSNKNNNKKYPPQKKTNEKDIPPPTKKNQTKIKQNIMTTDLSKIAIIFYFPNVEQSKVNNVKPNAFLITRLFTRFYKSVN